MLGLVAVIVDGVSIGAYRALPKIGEGSMGAVYVAEHMLLGRSTAIEGRRRARRL